MDGQLLGAESKLFHLFISFLQTSQQVISHQVHQVAHSRRNHISARDKRTMKSAFLLAAAISIGSSTAFTTAPSVVNSRPVTSLSMAKNNDAGKSIASAMAAASILAGVFSTDTAFAMDGPYATSPSFVDSSSVMLAGRSGGRYVPLFVYNCVHLILSYVTYSNRF